MTGPVSTPAARHPADTRLMLRVQRGDPAAFGLLYDRFSTQAYRVARAVGREPHADDIVQDAFLSIWRSRAAFRPDQGTVVAWVLGTVRNRAIDSRRRHARHERHRAGDASAYERVPARGDLESQVAERDDAAHLRAALARLPDAQREVIALAYFGELSTTDIAAELSLPLGTVKGRMRLGLEKLRSAGEDASG